MVIETALSKLVTSAASTLGSRLAKAALSKSRRHTLAMATAMRTDNILINIDWPPLPPNFDPVWLAGVVGTADFGALVRELLCLRLVNAPQTRHDELRSTFLHLLTEQGAGEFAEVIFDAIDDACARVVAETAQAHPDTHALVVGNAQLALIEATLQNTERHLRDLLQPAGYTSAEAAEFRTQYRRQVETKHGYIEPPDFRRRRRIPLEELYVSPTFQTDQTKTGLEELRADLDRAVILGDPGGGKTTASTAVILRTARTQDGPLPFLVTLREFAGSDISVLRYIEKRLTDHYQLSLPPGLVERHLVNGDAIVVFDGLDELIDTSRRRDITDIVELFSQRYPLARILVTSRRIGYDRAPMDVATFTTYSMSDFSLGDIMSYVRKWFRQQDWTEREGAEAAKAFLDESESVPDLRRNPLMLALMCTIYRGHNYIPRNRPAVYERCASMLFDEWDASRHIHVTLQVGRVIDPILKHLAYEMLTHAEGDDGMTRTRLIREVTRYLLDRMFEDEAVAQSAAVQFVDFCRDRAWVFRDAGTTADGEDIYAFTHRTFLEYFAAHQLVRSCETPEKLARKLLPKIAKSEWDVVGQLAVQTMDKNVDGGGDRVFTTMIEDRQRRAIEGRIAVLSFILRCLKFMTAKPAVVRELVRHVCGRLDHPLTLGALLQLPAELEQVALEELRVILPHLAADNDENTRIWAWLWIAALESIAKRRADDEERRWSTWREQMVIQHRGDLRQLGGQDPSLGQACVLWGVVPLSEYLDQGAHPGGLVESLLAIRGTPLLPWTRRCLVEAALDAAEMEPWAADCVERFTRHVVAAKAPYVKFNFELALTSTDRLPFSTFRPDRLFAALLLTSVCKEARSAILDDPPGRDAAWRRSEVAPNLAADQMALLDAWQAGEVDFVER